MGLFRLRKCRLGACATCRHCARRFNLWYYCALSYGSFGHLSDHDGCDHFDYYLHKPAGTPADAATPVVTDENPIEDSDHDMLEFDIIIENDVDSDELDEEFIDEYVDDEGDFDDDEYLDEGDYDDEDFDQERYDDDYYYYGNDGGEYD